LHDESARILNRDLPFNVITAAPVRNTVHNTKIRTYKIDFFILLFFLNKFFNGVTFPFSFYDPFSRVDVFKHCDAWQFISFLLFMKLSMIRSISNRLLPKN